MLNIYKYYDDAKALPLYSKIVPALAVYKDMNEWNPSMRRVLEPLEHLIAKDPKQAYNYAKHVIKGRWPEAEPFILKDVIASFRYANGVLKCRWPEAEPLIIKDPYLAYEYARDILAKDKEWTSQPGHKNGRWPEAEPEIMKDPQRILLYARYVIKGRWSEAEPIIKADDYYWERYKKENKVE